jgi:polysaccharide biosynthesis transport protein
MSAYTIATPDEEAPLVHALRVLRERWKVLVAALVLCVGAAAAISFTATKEYQATSELLFREDTLSNAILETDVFRASSDPQRESATNQRLVGSLEVAAVVKNRLRSDLTAKELLDKVEIESAENSDIIKITATDEDPQTAARIANGFAAGYVVHRRQADRDKVAEGQRLLRERLAALPEEATDERTALQNALQKLAALEAVQTGNAEVADRADVPTSPSSPRPVRNLVLGFLFGIALGIAGAFLRDALDRRVKTVEEFERLYGMRGLASIPRQSFAPRVLDAGSAAFEPYRILRNSLAFASFEKRIRIVLVTSAIQGEGKTSVAVNLARAMALSGERVVLMEADLRRPEIARHLDFDPAHPGLTTALLSTHRSEVVEYDAINVGGITVIPSGPLPPNPSEILQSSAMGSMLKAVSSTTDMVIIDAPPLLPVADAQILLDRPEIDACLIVGRAFSTKRDQVRRARSVIEQHRLQPLGVVVTGLRDSQLYEYYGPAKRPSFLPRRDGKDEKKRERKPEGEREPVATGSDGG